jgi:hypothetical protein
LDESPGNSNPRLASPKLGLECIDLHHYLFLINKNEAKRFIQFIFQSIFFGDAKNMPTSLLSTGVQFPDNSVQGVASNYILRTYTSPATWTKPTGLRAVKVSLSGGGGGGGGAFGFYGGGTVGRFGGSAFRYLAAPDIPGPITVTVGAGGTGGPGPGSGPGNANLSNGGTGGTSSFGPLLSATGGGGGGGGRPYGSPMTGTPGSVGTGTGSTIEQTLEPFGADRGSVCGIFSNVGRTGAGGAPPGPSPGGTGIGRSSGGGGGRSGPSPISSANGGAGAGGLVVVEEFY